MDAARGRAARVRRGGDPARLGGAGGRWPRPPRSLTLLRGGLHGRDPAGHRAPRRTVRHRHRRPAPLPDRRASSPGRRRTCGATSTWLPDEPAGPSEVADRLGARVLAPFRTVPRARSRQAATGASAEQLPDDPAVLSHLVAATAALTSTDRQRLLARARTAAAARELRCSTARRAARRVRAVPVAAAVDCAVRRTQPVASPCAGPCAGPRLCSEA